MSKQKLLITAKKDAVANGLRLQAMLRVFRSHFQVSVVDSLTLLTHPILKPLIIYLWLYYICTRFLYACKLRDYPLIPEMKFRAGIVEHLIKTMKPRIIICSSNEEMLVMKQHLPGVVKILDLPTSYAEEVKLSHEFSDRTVKTLKQIEQDCFQAADDFCTHWPSFLPYLKKKYQLKKGFVAAWGCDPVKKLSSYHTEPKVIWIGNLAGYWANPSLLTKLTKQSQFPIHIYGHTGDKVPPPHFKGYLENESAIANYQFGLITITNDELQRHGFSAKHLLYLSYGLPVLCPEWRRDPLLESATIYYNAQNFNVIVKTYSEKKLWLEKHRAALKLAKELQWERTVDPLIKKMEELLQVISTSALQQ